MYVYDLKFVHRIYQHRDCSIHSHPQLPHRNGKLYNNKSGGIVRSKKAYAVRDINWTEKYRRANRVASEVAQTAPKKIGQHAGNVLETQHASIKCVFPQFQIYPVHWAFLPVAQVKIIFSMNVKNTRKLLNKFTKDSRNFDEIHLRLLGEIDDINVSYLNLSKIKCKIDEFGHAYCWWDKIDRSLDTWFKGIRCESCVKKVSKLNSSDYIMLFYVVYHEMADEDWELGQLLRNDRKLRIIQAKLSYRMTIDEIKSFLWKEWNSKAGLTLDEIFDIEDDDNDDQFELPKNEKKSAKERYLHISCLLMYVYVCLCMFMF